MRKKILLIICALLSAGLLGAAAYIFMSSNGEAYDRINLEKDLADSYLEFVMSDENQKTTQSTRLEQESETEDVEAFIDQGENEELSTEFFEEENQEEGESGSEEAETDAAEESTSDTESESDEWGVEYVDVLEALARRRCAEVFANDRVPADKIQVNVQPLSGAPSNNAAYHISNPGDTVLAMFFF